MQPDCTSPWDTMGSLLSEIQTPPACSRTYCVLVMVSQVLTVNVGYFKLSTLVTQVQFAAAQTGHM